MFKYRWLRLITVTLKHMLTANLIFSESCEHSLLFYTYAALKMFRKDPLQSQSEKHRC